MSERLPMKIVSFIDIDHSAHIFLPLSILQTSFIFNMTRITRTTLLVAASAALLSTSVEGFSSIGFRHQVRSVAPVTTTSTTELWAKKKKKKNKKKKKLDGAATAVLEPPAAAVEEVEEAPIAVETPVAVVEEEPEATTEGEFEDPAIKMMANEMFQRRLLAQKLAYDAVVAESPAESEVEAEPEVEADPEPEPVAEATEPEPKPELEPVAEAAEPEPEPVAEVVEPEPEPEPEPVDLADKYAAIDDVGERAYQILKDLGMFDRED